MSRDGRTLVFAGEDQLYRRDLSQPVWHPIPGTENGVFPRLSPNSKRLAFVDDGLKIVPTNGGPAVTLVDWRQVRNPSWTSDDTIVFARGESGLFRIAIDGGNPERLTSSSLDGGRVQHRRPDVVPGGAVALYELGVTSGAHPSEIGVVSLATGERRSLLAGGNPRYVASGHILFVRGNALWAVPFDPDSLELGGSPIAVLEDVRVDSDGVLGQEGLAQLAVSDNGTLVYLPETGVARGTDRLVFVDRSGQVTPWSEEDAYYRNPRFSPDGTRIAVMTGTDAQEKDDVWVLNLDTGGGTRLTSGAVDPYPLWSPDGNEVAYYSSATGNIHVNSADGRLKRVC